jgi:hypothetical protein
VALPTTFVSSTQLTFQVLSSAGPGVHGLIVNTVTGIKSNTVSLTFVDGTTTEITFTTPSILPNAKVGQPSFVALNASSCGYAPGDDNCRWTASESSFPIGGLGLSSSYGNPVYIMGTPSKIYVNGVESQVPYTATFSFTVTSEYRSGFKQFTLTVDPATISQSSTGGVLGSEKFYFTQALREGAQGDQVMELQKLLNAKSGLGLVVDGKFGATTKSALMKFQVSNNLIVDGVVGPAVRAVLNK